MIAAFKKINKAVVVAKKCMFGNLDSYGNNYIAFTSMNNLVLTIKINKKVKFISHLNVEKI